MLLLLIELRACFQLFSLTKGRRLNVKMGEWLFCVVVMVDDGVTNYDHFSTQHHAGISPSQFFLMFLIKPW